MANELTFVNFSGSLQNGDPSNSKTVRSHVMRQYRKQKKAESKNKIKAAVERYKVPFHDTGIFSNSAKAREKAPHRVSSELDTPPSGVTSSISEAPSDSIDFDDVEEIERTDDSSAMSNSKNIAFLAFRKADLQAYHFLPVSASPKAPKLLHIRLLDHNLTRIDMSSIMRTSVHADPTRNYLSFYVDNAARLYMALSYSAAGFIESGNRTSESVDYHIKSMSAVNEDIADPEKQASDTMIETVATMANMENLNGNPKTAVLHLNGLKKMVELRGGVHCLGTQGTTRRVLLWCDLLVALRAQTLPSFPLVEFPIVPPLSKYTRPAFAKLFILDMRAMLLSKVFSRDHLQILQNLQRLHELTTFLNVVGEENEELPLEACYPDRLYSVEHHLVTSLGLLKLSILERQSDIWDVLRHASLLYIYTNLRQSPVGGGIRQSLSNRLRKFMLDTDLEEIRKELPAELMWMLCIGLVGSQGTSDYQWFFRGAERICMEYLLGSWEEVVEFCRVMPVLERACARKCECLWAENIFQ